MTRGSLWFRTECSYMDNGSIRSSGAPPAKNRPDFADWLSAWISGYIACRDGQLEDETLLAAAHRDFEQSGSQLAERINNGTATAADRERSEHLRSLLWDR